MKIISINLNELHTRPINIGYVGENNHVAVMIYCASLFRDYPDATASMVVQPPVGDLYPGTLDRDSNTLIWEVKDSDLTRPGAGKFQITFMQDEEIIKTAFGSFTVSASLVATGDPPEPIEDWMQEAQQVLNDLESFDNISASASTLPAGSSATAQITEVEGHKNISIGIPKGDPAPEELVVSEVDSWLEDHITNPSNPPLDTSLSLSNAAAPADLVGDLKSALDYATENIYNGHEIINYTTSSGYIGGTGSISSAGAETKEVYTDKIPVSKGDTIYISLSYPQSQSMWVVYATYDSEETFKTRITLVNSVTQSSYTGTIVIDEGVSYVAFTYRTYGDCTFKIEKNWDLADDVQKLNPLLANSKNLFNYPWTKAYYSSNGTYSTSPEYEYYASTKPSIPVTPEVTYAFSFGNIAFTPFKIYVHEFNSSGTRINVTNFTTKQAVIKMSANTVKIGIMVYNTNNTCTDWTKMIPSWTQMEMGNAVTYYVPPQIVNPNMIDSPAIINSRKDEIKETVYLSEPSVTVKTIAHRGDDISAPQCTAPSYIAARKNGILIAENDLWFSEDNQFVMWHDTTLTRLGNLVDINGYLMYTDGTNYYWVDSSDNSVYTWDGSDYVPSAVQLSNLTRCAGANYGVNSTTADIGLTLEILKRIDFGVYKGLQFAGTQILTFEEWIMLCKKLGMEVYVDKKFTYTTELITAAANIVKKCGMDKYTSWLNVGVLDNIALLRSILPNSRVGVLEHPNSTNITWYTEVNNAGRGFFFNGDAKNGMTAQAIQTGLNAGYDVEVWYVDYGASTEEQILNTVRTAVSYGVTGITLDHYKVNDAFEYLTE